MREIKFRAYDNIKNKMIYNVFYDGTWWVYRGDYSGTFSGTGNIKVGSSDGVDRIMQYTGLTDRNGKEIFEGDLLRYPALESWEEKNFVAFEVFFHDNDCADNHIGFQFNRLHFFGNIAGSSMINKFLPKYLKKMVVIGNIHENPELLEITK